MNGKLKNRDSSFVPFILRSPDAGGRTKSLIINTFHQVTSRDIIRYRLINQQIVQTKFRKPTEIVSWMGAMQAQVYPMAKWAIGLRLPGLNDADIEQAFNTGEILRTHLLRPTWHFVTPADIRWMLQLTGPRVNATIASMYPKLELDDKIFRRSNDILVKTLQGGKQLTRSTLKLALEKKKIVAEGLRLSCLMMRAELDGIICSGPKQGKQFTYVLLDEILHAAKVPAKKFDRAEALAELVKRYFTSRGPATVKDFVWWSGLTVKDAKEGLSMLPSHFIKETTDGIEYFFPPTTSKNYPEDGVRKTFLMPDYDEYGISYKNRGALFNPDYGTGGNPYSHWIVVEGQIAGTWQQRNKKNTTTVETTFFISLNKKKSQQVKDAVKRYITFTGGVSV